ncbi:putative inorganic carbon (hco3(-)) transporter [Methylomarinovum tepidoasis]|uniref:Inorganic carbon (Hco3(-)) transporter n=1 Tax=Methylomarinovum tepidoasis TaxID=2840183 RepID=A0AAU9CYN4_9GAMM|nr:O-antigen ligase family protein [Methylomarinovum sp. IN45]BCX87759.1 putative inorganic carbon (hco3(-)) transporter [Methylomarinovum sp. IN45]
MSRPISNWSFHCFLALLVWIPLPRASNRPEAWGLLEMLTFLLLQVWLWHQLRHRQPLPAAIRTAKPALWLWGAWLVWGLIQLIPLPPELLSRLSPKTAELQYLPPLAAERWASLSLSPHDTFVQWLKGLCYATWFFLTLALVNSRRRLRLLAGVIAASAALQAVYGTAMTLTGLELGFLIPKFAYVGTATGTFVNRNHFANYLALAAMVTVAAILAQLEDRQRPVSSRIRWRNLLNWLTGNKIWLRLALLVTAIGIVASRSRMGNGIFFLGLHLAGILAFIRWPRPTRPAILILIASMIILDVFIIGSLVGLERVAQRMEQTSPASEGRDEIARDTLHYWRDFLWTGSGLGTYAVMLPAYKQGDVKGFYDHAHNDYLELAAEAGLTGMAILGSLVILSLWQGWIALRRSRHPWKRAMALASLTAILMMLLHATVDFSLQIPANAVLFTLLLALAWICATPASAEPASPLPRPLWALLLPGLTTLQVLAFRLSASDYISNESHARTQSWQAAGTVPRSTWQRTYRLQQKAVALAPGNAWAWVNLARLNHWRHAFTNGPNPKIDRVSLQWLLRAAAAQPADARIWLAIATIRIAQGRMDALFRHSVHHAFQLAPWESKIQWSLLRLLLAVHPHLQGPERNLLYETLRHNRQLQPERIHRHLPDSDIPAGLCAETTAGATHPDVS